MIDLFVHDNGKVSVATVQRCGHTAMAPYFGFPPNGKYGTLEEWIDSDNPKIIVLRHPIERFWSACNMYKAYIESSMEAYDINESLEEAVTHHYNKFSKSRSYEDTQSIVRTFLGNNREERLHKKIWFIYGHHSLPYMHKIADVDFKFIDFSKLSNYIPKFGLVTNATRRDLDESFNDANGYYTKDDLYSEVETYFDLIKSKEEITVSEWNQLTK